MRDKSKNDKLDYYKCKKKKMKKYSINIIET